MKSNTLFGNSSPVRSCYMEVLEKNVVLGSLKSEESTHLSF